MKISREDLLRVSELAHLDLSPQEVETFRSQLDEILVYMDKLKELDISNEQPMAQVLHPSENLSSGVPGEPDAHPELRADQPQPCDIASAVLANSSESAPPFFRVPRVIDR